MPSKMQQVRVPMQPEQVKQLNAEAKARGISAAELIRQLLVANKIITETDIAWGGDRKSKAD